MLKNYKDIIYYYNLYFKKRVLGSGVLKLKFFRLYILIIFLILYFTAIFGVRTLLIEQNFETINTVSNIYILTILAWTFGLFIIVKYVFINSSGFINILDYFPFTKEEKVNSFQVYELIIHLLLILTITSIYSCAILLIDITKLNFVFTTVILSSIYFVVILNLIYLVLRYIFSRVVLFSKFKDLFALFGIVTLSIFYFNRVVNDLGKNYIDSLINKTIIPPDIINIWNYLGLNWGIFITSIFFIVFMLISWRLIVFLLAKTKNDYDENLYLILRFKNNNLIITYFLSLIRRKEFFQTFILLTLFLVITIITQNKQYSYFASFILSYFGIYLYFQKNVIYGKVYHTKKDLLFNLISMNVSLLLICLPLYIFFNFDALNIDLILSLIISVSYFISLGIFFPTRENNPFSPFIGTLITLFLTIFILFVFFIIDPKIDNMISSRISTVLLIILIELSSLYMMNKLRKEERNEKKY
jgi:hypothetical protein